MIFWSDVGQNVISSAGMDGSDYRDIVTGVSAYGLAIDYQGNWFSQLTISEPDKVGILRVIVFCTLGTHLNCLAAAILMSTHSVCFYGEIWQIIPNVQQIPTLSNSLIYIGVSQKPSYFIGTNNYMKTYTRLL